jgi:hypothetical protein
LHDVINELDTRKSAMGKPKLYADFQRELAAKAAVGEAAPKRKKKRRINSPKNDLMTRGKRLKGSGWSGLNRK